MQWSVFILIKTLPAWLRLPREQRSEIAASSFESAFKEGTVTMQYFDAEAFSGRCTDIMVFKTNDLKAYYFAIERLRDSALFTTPYFEVVDIIPTIEEGFKLFEGDEQVAL